jgi:hypothetical protein
VTDEELQKRREALANKRDEQRTSEAKAHALQEIVDLEAIAELEAEHGFDRVLPVKLIGWKPGADAATHIAVRVPLKRESLIKRYESQITKPKADLAAALHTLAEACVVYPDRKTQKDLYEATMELAPGILSKSGGLIVKAVEGKADEEKKD